MSQVVVFVTRFFHSVIYLAKFSFSKGFHTATSTYHSSHSSIASSTQHERPIILQDDIYLLRLLDAMESDDNHDDKFKE